jgi:hypothetical protein
MASKKIPIGFGFNPDDSEHHFLVSIPKHHSENIIIYERFKWQRDQESQEIDENIDKPKVTLSYKKWKIIEDSLGNEFNSRLRQNNLPISKWKPGQNILERLLGKELILLAWAIEDVDESLISIAVRNWQGLSPEERWWLFTMTNASTGGLYDKKGWRKALRYALTENPIMEKDKQISLFESLIDRGVND